MILHIDTAAQKISVSLKKNRTVINSLSQENEYGSQVLLPLIMKLLNYVSNPGLEVQRESRILGWKQLKGIEVVTGPGSFTGLRVGVSVANTLGFALGITVNGKQMETNLSY